MGVSPIGNGGVYHDGGSEEKEFTPLHSAAFEGHIECVKVLLEKGNLDVDAKDDLGKTATQPEMGISLSYIGSSNKAQIPHSNHHPEAAFSKQQPCPEIPKF
jgi:hypothetical protein